MFLPEPLSRGPQRPEGMTVCESLIPLGGSHNARPHSEVRAFCCSQPKSSETELSLKGQRHVSPEAHFSMRCALGQDAGGVSWLAMTLGRRPVRSPARAALVDPLTPPRKVLSSVLLLRRCCQDGYSGPFSWDSHPVASSLHFEHFSVTATEICQLFMASLFCDLTVFENYDAIGHTHGGEPMRDK